MGAGEFLQRLAIKTRQGLKRNSYGPGYLVLRIGIKEM